MTTTPWPIFTLCFIVVPAFADSNGMDMSMDMPMDLAAGNMLTYLHFTPGDTVWFLGWVPSSAGAMVGACIGLFLLSVLERLLAACLELATLHWAERASVLVTEKSDHVTSIPSLHGSPSPSPSPSSTSERSRWYLVPFVPELDIARGVLFGAHSFLKVLLMLAIMTFQGAFLLSIAIGSGVGETLFGRFSMSSYEH